VSRHAPFDGASQSQRPNLSNSTVTKYGEIVILSAAKDLARIASSHEILRCAQDDKNCDSTDKHLTGTMAWHNHLKDLDYVAN
jgi:hypothetical protein